MKVYKYTTYLTAITCMITLAFAYYMDSIREAFWSNTFIGIFGSGFLAFLGSIIAYFVLKKRILNELYIRFEVIIRDIYTFFKESTLEEDRSKCIDKLFLNGEKSAEFIRDYSTFINKSSTNTNLRIFIMTVKTYFHRVKTQPKNSNFHIKTKNGKVIEINSYDDFEILYLNFIRAGFGKKMCIEVENQLDYFKSTTHSN